MKITFEYEVDALEWDGLAEKLGGGYHHCHSAILAEALNANAQPLFVKALHGKNECAGIAACTIAQSRIWPFSQYCKYAMMSSLPATLDSSAASQQSIMKKLEEYLCHEGAFKIKVFSATSTIFTSSHYVSKSKAR